MEKDLLACRKKGKGWLPGGSQSTEYSAKHSDFSNTSLTHILQVIPVCYILRCYCGNKFTKGTLQNLGQWKSGIF